MYHIFYHPQGNDYLAVLEKPNNGFTVLEDPHSGHYWSNSLSKITSSFTPSPIRAESFKKVIKDLSTSASLCATVTSLKDLESAYPELFL